jgi:hypothetical protein
MDDIAHLPKDLTAALPILQIDGNKGDSVKRCGNPGNVSV